MVDTRLAFLSQKIGVSRVIMSILGLLAPVTAITTLLLSKTSKQVSHQFKRRSRGLYAIQWVTLAFKNEQLDLPL